MSQQKESGFVSIITAILLMVVLSLITLGFTRLMQREQRQALDRQLSRTALYAAESGVNDVLAAIAAGTTGYDGINKTTCTPGAIPSANLSGDGNVAVTCAMFDNQPGSLEYDIDTNGSKIVEMKTASNNNFSSFTIRFGRQGGSNDLTTLPTCNTPAVGNFPSTRANGPPLIRFDLTSISTPYDRATLMQNTDYMYIAPCNDSTVSGTSSQAFNTTSRGRVVEARCSGGVSQPCEVHINTLVPASNTFFARIRPVYADASLAITAQEDNGAGGNQDAQFADAQVAVDVTAKASDVVRRLRVNVPLSANVAVPEAVLHVFNGICKQLEFTSTPTQTLVDRCLGPPSAPPVTPPASVTCPTAAGAVTMNSYNLSSIALSNARRLQGSPRGSERNRRLAITMIDVIYDTNTANPNYTTRLEQRYSNPDLDIASFSSNPAEAAEFRVADGCSYSVDYTLHCSARLAPWGTPPGADQCFPEQVNEGFTANFYSQKQPGNPNQCDRNSRLAYVQFNDVFVGPVSSGSFSGTANVVLTGAYGQISCMELVTACEDSQTHPGCTNPNPTDGSFSSIYFHSMDWIERPL